MFEEFRDRADFLTLYIREAHAKDEWPMSADVCYLQPKTLAQRLSIAQDFVKRYNYQIAMVVDNMDDGFEKDYFAWPERLFVIEDGEMQFVGGPGPYGYKPEEVREWLVKRFETPHQ